MFIGSFLPTARIDMRARFANMDRIIATHRSQPRFVNSRTAPSAARPRPNAQIAELKERMAQMDARRLAGDRLAQEIEQSRSILHQRAVNTASLHARAAMHDEASIFVQATLGPMRRDAVEAKDRRQSDLLLFIARANGRI